MSALPCPQAARLPGIAAPAADPWVTAIETLPTAIRDPATIPPPLPPVAPIPENRWPYHLPRWSAIDALWWAMLVRASYAPTDFWVREVASWAGPVIRLSYTPPTDPATVGRALVELPDQWLLILPGTTSDSERNAYLISHALASVTSTQIGTDSFTLNSTWAARGEVAWAAAVAWPYPPAKPVTVIGHSAGGGTAVVPFMRHLLGPGEQAETLVTFGAMIWGMPDTNDVIRLRKAQVIEFTSQGDPVPLLPPPWSVLDTLQLSYPRSTRPTYVRGNALLELRGIEGAFRRPPQDADLTRTIQTIISLLRGQLLPAEHSARFYSRICLDWARSWAGAHGHRDLLAPLESLQEDMAEAGL